MKTVKRVSILVALAAASCGDDAPPATRELGMNDVSILVPLLPALDAPTLLSMTRDATPLVPRDRFNALVADPQDIGPKLGGTVRYEDFHVVAVRFDLCLHDAAGPCREGETGRVRLVLQPLYVANDKVLAHDIALHAFYPIDPDELGDVVRELRSLAALQDAPLNASLTVSPALARDPTGIYPTRLRALVERYAQADRLVRLTVIGQNADSAAFAWAFRGIALGDAGWAEIRIPEIRAFTQKVLFAGGDAIYSVFPGADSPPGIAFALNGALFDSASADAQRYALEALATVQNPNLRGPGTTQCIACHVSTFLTRRRATTSGIDPATLQTPKRRSTYGRHRRASHHAGRRRGDDHDRLRARARPRVRQCPRAAVHHRAQRHSWCS